MTYTQAERQIWAKRGGRIAVIYEASDELMAQIAQARTEAHQKSNNPNSKKSLEDRANYWGRVIEAAVKSDINLSGFCINLEVQNTAKFKNALKCLDLSGGKFTDAEFLHFDFENVNFTRANLDGTRFEHGTGSLLNFSGASMRSCNIKNMNLDYPNLHGTALDDSRISMCKLTPVIEKTSLRNTIFVASEISIYAEGESYDEKILGDINLENAQFLACVFQGKRSYTTIKTTLNDQGAIDFSGSYIRHIDIKSEGFPIYYVTNALLFNDPRLTQLEREYIKNKGPWLPKPEIPQEYTSSFYTEKERNEQKEKIEIAKRLEKEINVIITYENNEQARVTSFEGALGINGSYNKDKIFISSGMVVYDAGPKTSLPIRWNVLQTFPEHLLRSRSISKLQSGCAGVVNLIKQIESGVDNIHHAEGMADVLSYGDLLTRVFMRASALYADTCSHGHQQQLSLAETLRPLDRSLRAHGYLPKSSVSLIDRLFGNVQPDEDDQGDMRTTFAEIENTLAAHSADMITRVGLFESLQKLFEVLGKQMRAHAHELDQAKPDPLRNLDETIRDCKLQFNLSAHVADMLGASLAMALKGQTKAAIALRGVIGSRVPTVASVIGTVYARNITAHSQALQADTANILLRAAHGLGLTANKIAPEDAKIINQLCENLNSLRKSLDEIDNTWSKATLELKPVEEQLLLQ